MTGNLKRSDTHLRPDQECRKFLTGKIPPSPKGQDFYEIGYNPCGRKGRAAEIVWKLFRFDLR